MLRGILSSENCAECRVCCVFDKDDIWEYPLITDDVKSKAHRHYSGEYEVYRGKRIMKIVFDDAGLAYCPLLSENGCLLGGEKPFDCRIWPYRVMNLAGMRVVTVSPVCETIFEQPLAAICKKADELLPQIREYVDAYPEAIIDYITNYPILRILEE